VTPGLVFCIAVFFAHYLIWIIYMCILSFPICRIDDDVESAVQNVEAGGSELMKNWESVRGNKLLLFKMFSALIVFIILTVLMM